MIWLYEIINSKRKKTTDINVNFIFLYCKYVSILFHQLKLLASMVTVHERKLLCTIAILFFTWKGRWFTKWRLSVFLRQSSNDLPFIRCLDNDTFQGQNAICYTLAFFLDVVRYRTKAKRITIIDFYWCVITFMRKSRTSLCDSKQTVISSHVCKRVSNI
jgi:hypothetical protein